MAKKGAKMGVTARVRNTNPRNGAAGEYIALWIEDEDGSEASERCLLFTERQFASLRAVSLPSCFKASSMKRGRIYTFSTAPRNGRGSLSRRSALNLVLVEHDGKDIVVSIPNFRIGIAESTAKANPEDVPVRSALSDFLD